MADYQLAAALEQVEQARFAIRSFEYILLFDPDHRQPAALGAHGVALPGQFLLPGEQVLAGG
jgi:hypothetical protein